mgnify:CR=1 FL=1
MNITVPSLLKGHQGYRLIGGGFAPIAELRRDNDHFLVILLGLKAEGFRLGKGTVAEGWIKDAAAFWESQFVTPGTPRVQR